MKNNYPAYVDAVVRAVLEYIGESSPSDTYVVQAGDSLWSIAKKFNTTVDELKKLNNLTSNTLKIGQKLKIPTENNEPQGTGFYIVKKGDSLYSIARQYNTTVEELMRLNNLTSSSLSIGQQLKVPAEVNPPITDNYIINTVKAGDSLYSIERQYNTTVNELMDYNNLTTNLLSVGQKLKVPTEVQVNPPTSTPEPGGITYTVQRGDSLYNIAGRYNTTVDAIMKLNNLNSTSLSIGQVLKIPLGNTNTETRYVVKAGDNLYNIARQYNTTVDEIRRRNNLSSNNLSIGQVLIIP